MLVLQDYIIATERAVSGRPAHLWLYDRKSDDFSGYKLALSRQPNDIVMYDARRQLTLDCESLLGVSSSLCCYRSQRRRQNFAPGGARARGARVPKFVVTKSSRSESRLALGLRNLRAFANSMGARASVPHDWRRN